MMGLLAIAGRAIPYLSLETEEFCSIAIYFSLTQV